MTALNRLAVSLALGVLAAFVSMLNAMSPRRRDFEVVWQAAQALVHGQDAYTALPGLLYPLPGIVAAAPFALLPPGPLACGLFMLLGATVFAWALLGHGRSALIGFGSAGMYIAAQWVQWSPLHAGAYGLAPLGVFLVVKPHTGFPILLARPSRWAIGGGLLCVFIAFLVDPAWLAHWRASVAFGHAHLGAASTGLPYTAPALLPGGFAVLLALTRWRRPEARLLVALACVPQSLLLYETVPLALIPRGWKESAAFTVLSYVVLWLIPRPPRSYSEFALASGELSTLLLYLPLTLMLLRRPNEGAVGAWLERRMSRWPAWLRGVSGDAGPQTATSQRSGESLGS
jgi:hypothetical protein